MKHDLPAAGLAPHATLRGDAGAIVLVGTIAALYFAREILIPFAFALTLTFLLTPVVALLQKLHAGRVVSVLTTVLVSVAVAGGIGWIIANQLVDVANQIPLYRQNIRARIERFSPSGNGADRPSRQERAGDCGGTHQPQRAIPGLGSTGPKAEPTERTARGRVSYPRSDSSTLGQRMDGTSRSGARLFLRLSDGQEWSSSLPSSCC